MMSETEVDDFHNDFKPLNVNKQRKKRHRLKSHLILLILLVMLCQKKNSIQKSKSLNRENVLLSRARETPTVLDNRHLPSPSFFNMNINEAPSYPTRSNRKVYPSSTTRV